MSFLTEVQDIIDSYPTISKGDLKIYLEVNFSDRFKDAGDREYTFGLALYWFSLRNLAVLLDDVISTVSDFEDEDERVKDLVIALENHFIEKA